MSTDDHLHLLRERILEEELRSKILEPSPKERATWQAAVDQNVNEFVDNLPQARTFTPRSASTIEDFDRAVEECETVPKLLTLVKNAVQDSGLLTAGPGHLAFVPGGGIYLGAVADHLASALNPFSADGFAAPIAAHMHNESIQWLCDLVGFGPGAYGDLTSGGTHATLSAFHAARRARQIKARDIPFLCIYVGEHTHHCCHKALDVLFGGEIQIRAVPSKGHAMDPIELNRLVMDDLAAGLIPWVVVATAGSTNLGCVDPLDDISKVAKHHRLWFHVDAAYGGFFAALPELKETFFGIEQADSVVLDPHKGMFLPYGSGAVLLKEGGMLRQGSTGAYLQDRALDPDPCRSPMDYALELTRPFRALRLWLALKVHGKETFTAASREKRLLAIYCAKKIEVMPNVTLVAQPDLSIFAFKFRDRGEECDAQTAQLLACINKHPEVFLSSTRVDGRMVIRVAILAFRTHLATIDRLIAIIQQESDRIAMETARV